MEKLKSDLAGRNDLPNVLRPTEDLGASLLERSPSCSRLPYRTHHAGNVCVEQASQCGTFMYVFFCIQSCMCPLLQYYTNERKKA